MQKVTLKKFPIQFRPQVDSALYRFVNYSQFIYDYGIECAATFIYFLGAISSW